MPCTTALHTSPCVALCPSTCRAHLLTTLLKALHVIVHTKRAPAHFVKGEEVLVFRLDTYRVLVLDF